jgi:phosphoglycolate phosphatase
MTRDSDWPRAILFDLDGTLIDSAPDIAAAVNDLLKEENLGPLSVEAVRRMIGNGVVKLVERAYAACGHALLGAALDERVKAMMPHYANHLTGLTVLLPGALEVVSTYAMAEVKIAVVSNKPDAFTRTILEHYGFAPHLAAMQGQNAKLKTKPAPDMLFATIDQMGVAAADALFVGDSINDLGAAKAAGMACVLVHGGYSIEPLESFGADAVCDTLFELPQAILKAKALEA